MIVALNGEDTDVEIIEGFLRNDEGVQKRFYKRCWIYYCEKRMGVFEFHANANTPDDLFQDTFIKLWEEIQTARIRIHQGEVWRLNRDNELKKMSASLLSFFMSIAKNKNYELGREADNYEALAPQVSDRLMEEEEEERFIDRIVSQCLENLPNRCRDILTKFYYYGMSLDDILRSREENVSKDGLKSGKSKCMGQLKKNILEKCKIYNIKSYGHV